MFADTRIAVRLGMGFGFIILLLVVVSGLAMMKMDILANLTNELYDHPFAVSMHVREVEIAMLKIDRSMKDVVLARTPGELESAVTKIGEYEKQAYESLRMASERFLGEKAQTEHVKEFLDAWRPLRDEVIALSGANKRSEAAALAKGRGAQQVAKLDEEMSHLTDFASESAAAFIEQAEGMKRSAFLWIYALVLLAVAVSAWLAFFTSRAITRPLETGVTAARRLAGGDMTVEIEAAANDETGQLLKALALMAKNLRDMARETREGINVLASSASEILASTTQVVSAGAETTAAVSQTTSTVEEVKQTVQVASQKARSVAESAEKVSLTAQEGRKSVESSVDGMDRIQEQMESVAESVVQLSEQSQAIGAIIATVNDLAEQSNLLSVNAAIEAAKAGEQGKGFAVVAQEVKSLAEQSREATAQVRSILEDIQKATDVAVMATERGSKAVSEGSKQIAEAGEAIRTLAESVEQAAQSAVQIQASSQQQVVGMDQIAQAMDNIKLASEQNVESMKQVEETVQNFHALGQKLKQLTDRYQV